MSLPASDMAYLAERAIEYSIDAEANMTCLVLKSYVLPPGYAKPHADLLLRFNPGYPDVQPDMWWFDPPVGRADGQSIAATDAREQHLGRTWQRWSRHLVPGQWRSGIDCLETFLALVRKELERCALKAAA